MTIQEMESDIWKDVYLKRTPGRSVLIAIDGRCGAGKTTLAAYISSRHECNVIHMDHFFLRPEQQTGERLGTPGGNIDHERFLEEVLLPLHAGRRLCYRVYDCHKQRFSRQVQVEPRPVTIIEGSYSAHPKLWEYYDQHIFLDIDKGEQYRRILERNGAGGAALFRDRWIPLEEMYFSAYEIKKRCEKSYMLG